MNVKVCLDAPALARRVGGTVVQSQHPDIPKDAQVVFQEGSSAGTADSGSFLLHEDRRYPAVLVHTDPAYPPHVILEVAVRAGDF